MAPLPKRCVMDNDFDFAVHFLFFAFVLVGSALLTIGFCSLF